MSNFNKLCTAMATLNDEQSERVISYIETLDKSQTTTKTDKWERIINEEYLCKFWNDDKDDFSRGNLTKYAPADASEYLKKHPFRRDDKQWYKNCEVLREKGIKQPYFQGDDIPEIKGTIFIYYTNEYTKRINRYYSQVKLVPDWEYVSAYIEV